jgi:hypothetical protein
LQFVTWNEWLYLTIKEVAAEIGNLLTRFREASIFHLIDARRIIQRVPTRRSHLIDAPDCLSMMAVAGDYFGRAQRAV